MVVLRMISPKTGFLSFGKVLVSSLNSSVLRTLSPYRVCSKVLLASAVTQNSCSTFQVRGPFHLTVPSAIFLRN